MTEMIRVEDMFFAGIPAAASFAVSGGCMMVLLTSKEEVNARIARLIIGLEPPPSGKVFLFGSDCSALSAHDLHAIRCRIGSVPGDGGLISNLKVWENLTLPLYYHQHLSPEEIEHMGLAMLDRFGYTGKLMDLPAHLSNSQKKLVGFARSMLMNPDVMVYESPLTGLDQMEKSNFLRIVKEFHFEKAGRSSLFITSNEEVARYLPDAVVVNLTTGHVA